MGRELIIWWIRRFIPNQLFERLSPFRFTSPSLFLYGVKPYFWQGWCLEVPFFSVKSLASLLQEIKRWEVFWDNIFAFLTKSLVSPPIKDDPECCGQCQLSPSLVAQGWWHTGTKWQAASLVIQQIHWNWGALKIIILYSNNTQTTHPAAVCLLETPICCCRREDGHTARQEAFPLDPL